MSIDTPAGVSGPYPASQFAAAGTGFRAWHNRDGGFYDSTNRKRVLFVRFDGTAGAGEYVLRLDDAASSAHSEIHFFAFLNTRYGQQGRFLNFVSPGSIWDGATAFRNVAPNSYVIRTNWTDIDGNPRGLFGAGNVGELWTGSSVGPTADGRSGVDVSAPGDRIVTTYGPQSNWASFPHLLIEGGDGLYGMAALSPVRAQCALPRAFPRECVATDSGATAPCSDSLPPPARNPPDTTHRTARGRSAGAPVSPKAVMMP